MAKFPGPSRRYQVLGLLVLVGSLVVPSIRAFLAGRPSSSKTHRHGEIVAWSTTNGAGGESMGQAATRRRRPRAIPSLLFAENGVAIRPAWFVVTSSAAANATTDYQHATASNVFTMRNVPGNGDCMFLAVALAAATSLGLGGNDALLEAISKETRAVVAQVLNATSGDLLVSDNQTVSASVLLKQAARQEQITPEEYLQLLMTPGRQGGLYGGGPELTVLSNVLRRPISIYEIDQKALAKELSSIEKRKGSQLQSDDVWLALNNTCPIVHMGTFGKGAAFADPCETHLEHSAVLSNLQPGAYSWHLHILILPVSPTEKHASVLLPQPIEERQFGSVFAK